MLKGTTTNIALVRTFFGVNASMNLQILLDAEELMTEFTFERPLTGVGAIMAYLWGKKRTFSKLPKVEYSIAYL